MRILERTPTALVPLVRDTLRHYRHTKVPFVLQKPHPRDQFPPCLRQRVAALFLFLTYSARLLGVQKRLLKVRRTEQERELRVIWHVEPPVENPCEPYLGEWY